MERARDIFCFAVRPKKSLGGGGQDARRLAAEARALGLNKVQAVYRAALYFVSGNFTPKELDLLGRFLFSDSISEDFCWEGRSGPTVDPGPQKPGAFSPFSAAQHIETALRPGVTDPVAEEVLRAAPMAGIRGLEAVSTGECFNIESTLPLCRDELDLLARRLLANPVIQRYSIGRIQAAFLLKAAESPAMERYAIADMSDASLAELSERRRTALDPEELREIRDYFRKEGRPCTDAEIETIAQTWSEHCVHKTFRAKVRVENSAAAGTGTAASSAALSGAALPYPPVVDNILKSYIKKATDEIAAPWVLSAFVDNAGVIALDGSYEISFKVETHNHPSAVEPFGGANTGVGGVIRDIMGVSAKPVAVTDVLCFGPPDLPPESLKPGLLHPRRIASGVIAGVQDYGNKMGIPTVNGGIHYHPGYSASPLVYCGCAGIAPRGSRRHSAKAGDRVIIIGGRTGRDGIRGATFSSMVMDASTGDLAGASVQIGAPIVQRKAAEVLLEARDADLYSAVTDCGAGGLSSAVGEMAEELGAEVDLARVPVKYPGLAAWEIWLSEAQERMVLAVPPEKVPALKKLCADRDVELTDFGAFTGTGRLVVRQGSEMAVDLDCHFLFGGRPQRELVAKPPKAAGHRMPASSAAMPAGTGAGGSAVPGPAEALLAVLAHPAVASKEDTVRRYDHEVQGAMVLRPYDGLRGDGPQDAAVLAPHECGGSIGFCLSNGFNARYGAADPHNAAVSAVDEAVRNAVAVGADPERIAVLDNFCMGDPKRPETMWALLEAARGCYEEAIAQRTPFISGKDSFNNEYQGPEGLQLAIPPSLLISAMGIVPDPGRVPGSDFKTAGDFIYLVGSFKPLLGASVYAELFGAAAESQRPSAAAGSPAGVPGQSEGAHRLYGALHSAISAGLVRACHDLSDGGAAAALAEMCIGGRLGASIEASSLRRAAGSGAAEPSWPCLLFGETNGCLAAEVAPADAAAFEACFAASKGAGGSCVRIGTTDASSEIRFKAEKADGMESFGLPLDSLAASFGVMPKNQEAATRRPE